MSAIVAILAYDEAAMRRRDMLTAPMIIAFMLTLIFFRR